MGKAIILTDVNFASANLGVVTPIEDVPITGIGIVAPATFEGAALQLEATLTPAQTTQRQISWSLTSGSEYATINATTGVLTILQGADNDNVTIKVESVSNPAVYATKTIAVTYHEEPGIAYAEKSALVTDGLGQRINTGYAFSDAVSKVEIKFMVTENDTSKYQTIWAIYTGEDNCCNRHLLLPPGVVSRQLLQFGSDIASGSTNNNGVVRQSNYVISTNVQITDTLTPNSAESAPNTTWQEVVISPNGNVFDENPLVLFAATKDYVSTASYWKGKMYPCKIWENDTLAVELVPCVLIRNISASESWDSQAHNVGECGMWDKVRNKFYGNAVEYGTFTTED